MYSKTLNNKRGFTLIEILIVASLIAILSSMVGVSWRRIYQENVEKFIYVEMRQMATAVSTARTDTGYFFDLKYLAYDRFYWMEKDTGGNYLYPLPMLDMAGKVIWNGTTITEDQAREHLENIWTGPYFSLANQHPVDADGNPLDRLENRYYFEVVIDFSKYSSLPTQTGIWSLGWDGYPGFRGDDNGSGITDYQDLNGNRNWDQNEPIDLSELGWVNIINAGTANEQKVSSDDKVVYF
jgi:prepilin-type N-terminal cleavage/methylation domain-containing protein